MKDSSYYAHVQWNLRILETLGSAILSFVEKLSSLAVENVLILWISEHFEPLEASFIERLFLYSKGPLSEVPL